ncbi:hypothetical protein [Nocardia nepalensis]|uniref:hypothetical protein n=1 Tax=Nocardia nepalensis TaxID=3375448 RepID=UPI003B67303E
MTESHYGSRQYSTNLVLEVGVHPFCTAVGVRGPAPVDLLADRAVAHSQLATLSRPNEAITTAIERGTPQAAVSGEKIPARVFHSYDDGKIDDLMVMAPSLLAANALREAKGAQIPRIEAQAGPLGAAIGRQRVRDINAIVTSLPVVGRAAVVSR